MKSLKGIKRRVTSISGTMKVLGAMKAISASKIKGVNQRVIASRRYKDAVKEMALQAVAKGGEIDHPAFILRPKLKKIALVAILPQKGFCGALTENTVKQIQGFLELMKDKDIEVKTWLVGAKGMRTFKRHGIEFEKLDIQLKDDVGEDDIKKIRCQLFDLFWNGDYNQVILAYNKLISVISQRVVLEMFLPIWVKDDERPALKDKVDFLYEPNKSKVLEVLLKEVLEAELYNAFIESLGSELAARMVAMDNALNNAKDMVKRLTRDYNTLRQGAITTELSEIIGGTEALSGCR